MQVCWYMAADRPSDTGDSGVLAAYAVLSARYESNTTLQWQIPAYVIAIEGSLLAGVLIARGLVTVLLGSVAFILSGVGSAVMRRIELTARWDRELLDLYETRLLASEPDLQLHHGKAFRERLQLRELRSSRSRLKTIELRCLLWVPPSLSTMILIIVLGLLALAVGLARA
jgi:hypothetical protein